MYVQVLNALIVMSLVAVLSVSNGLQRVQIPRAAILSLLFNYFFHLFTFAWFCLVNL